MRDVQQVFLVFRNGPGALRAVRDAGAVVDDGVSRTQPEKGRQVRHATLEFECCRHAVHRLELVGAGALAVCVQVYKARRNDEATCVNFDSTRQRLLRNRDHRLAANPHVAHCVEACLRIHKTTVQKDDVVAVLGERRHAEEQQCCE